ncbi:polysaccharide biosynthesis/export family protein [Adhaeribacter sp. BT258]|uniref:Polysaccharide biosynthesis/export family protein n=2 Tax=Adhaeribacter terrigena TaxID=2793070 RepID=A0ABS1BWX5_9BACT|nr:polysaccharide biosynthesis/export family protein [Adhaeribacter terrigena]
MLRSLLFKLPRYGCFLLLFVSLWSCSVYRQNIMFRTDGDVNIEKMRASLATAEKNYVIQPNDYLDVRVYTNRGERILDPNGEILRSLSGGMIQNQIEERPRFLVQSNGIVKLPMVDYVKVSGLTLLEADSLLQVMFTKFYKDVYVITKVLNNRIIVLGAPGGKVIPMTNDNMNLIEVLAAAGGVDKNGKVHNIRLIRGDLQNPSVQVINLATIEGMRKAALNVEPNDIVYVEPVRRVFLEALADYLPVFSAVTGVLTTYIVIKDLIEN